jgi:subtilisin family serine protease
VPVFARSAPALRRLTVLSGTLALVATSVGPVAAASPPAAPPSPAIRDEGQAWDDGFAVDSGGVIVTFKPGTTTSARDKVTHQLGLTAGRPLDGVDAGVYRRDPANSHHQAFGLPSNVVSVTPDLRLHRHADPTGEQLWDLLWGLHNTGQPIRGSTGTPNIDIDALEAQAITTGDPSTVVAVIDDGVDFSHPDLAARAWSNPGESGGGKETNGVDDDANGYIDDVHGWDFCNDDNTVHDFDQDFHGTHVAGTIAASLDGQGVVGVAPGVKIMALKFLDNGSSCGLTSQAIEAIAYAKSFGVVLSNSSWGGRGQLAEFLPLYDAIADSGLLFVTSAGNEGIDNDHDPSPAYPASFDLPNVITVAAADKDGGLADFSNYGHTRVDLSAPGVDIASTWAGDSIDPSPGWAYMDGTSMAAPHVTGVAALLASQDPTLLEPANLATLKSRLLSSGKPLPLTVGDTVTGRLADARYALDGVAPTAFAPNTQILTVGSVLGATAVSATIGWPAATDDASGIASYDLQQQVNGGAWTTVLAGTTARSVARALTIDAIYKFRVRARDRAGNLSPYLEGASLTTKRFQETTSLAKYAGSWALSSSTSWSGGKTRYASKASASVSFTFIGRAVAVVAPKSTTRGSVRVYVDNVYKGPLSLYRSPSASRMLVFGASWTANGSHTVKFVVVGTAGRPRIDIDAWMVLR